MTVSISSIRDATVFGKGMLDAACPDDVFAAPPISELHLLHGRAHDQLAGRGIDVRRTF
ncbi:MAG: hypothetical protein ABW001_05315 [Mycobacterium sp.]